MIYLTQEVLAQITAHARRAYPIEACGYLAGNENNISRCFEMKNVDNSEEHFSFDPTEQFLVIRNARKAGLEILANYHSHPATPARPSEEDIKLAYDPNILYFIISLAENIPIIKAFKIQQSEVLEEPILIKEIF